MVLALNAVQSTGAYGKFVHSAQNFQRYYNDLKQGQNTLSPIERFVFSLVLANSNYPEQTSVGELPVGHT